MILSLCLNPSLDKTVSLPRFSLDAPNRVTPQREDVGGKGVNVARAATALGAPCLLLGLDFDHSPVAVAMREAGVRFHLLPGFGKLRTNWKIQETSTGRTIEINESGPILPDDTLNAVEDALRLALRPGDWATLSGSLPPGAGKETYARLARTVAEAGAFAAVDCDGPALQAAVKARPALIKPNAQEFAALTGADPASQAECLAACRELIKEGVGAVCLSRGGEGALLVTPEGAWACPAAQVKPQGLQGAGDSLLAGLLTAFLRGLQGGEALAFASAAAGASVKRPGTLLCEKKDVEALLPTLSWREV